MARKFRELSEQEVLALAITLEEEDGRIYADFAEGLRETYAATAKLFTAMQAEEAGHRNALIETYRQRFGEHIPLIRRQDVKGFVDRRPVWQVRPLGLNVVRRQAETMDGSVSTLAPLFAAAFATRSSWAAFLAGLAASVGAGISMGFAEALSDDGSLTGRGHPWLRGLVCGFMTTGGGIGHTLPFLIANFHVAMLVAVAVVAAELAAISYIRHRYMDTPFLSAAFQVVVGGVLVFLAGILIGSS
jgi:rubrerythrin